MSSQNASDTWLHILVMYTQIPTNCLDISIKVTDFKRIGDNAYGSEGVRSSCIFTPVGVIQFLLSSILNF